MRRRDHAWSVVLPWVVATTGGLAFASLSILTLVTGLALAGATTVLVGLIGGAALGGGVGVAQWLALRGRIPKTGWWVLASAAGGTLGVALGLVLSDALGPLGAALLDETARARPAGARVLWISALAVGGAGGVLGLTLGGAQWLVLRRHVPSAGWWIVASGLGWMAGLGVSAGTVELIGVFPSLLVAGGIVGTVTGSLLAYLLSGGADPSRRVAAV